MNLHPTLRPRLTMRVVAMAFALGTFSAWVAAGPGAHGPNGEHLDAPSSDASPAVAVPQMSAETDQFELVAQLSQGELSILIDRYATNEPVHHARVEVESGAFKAEATFHKDIGDYAVDDPAMLAHLRTPGEHAVVITVMAGDDSDLLEGILRVSAEATTGHGHDDAHAHGARWLMLAGGGAVAAVLLAVGWRWRQRDRTRASVHTADGDAA